MNSQRTICLITAAMFTVTLFTGCSVVGYSIGAYYDHIVTEELHTIPLNFEYPERDARIKVVMLDGTIHRGRYGGIKYSDETDYHGMLELNSKRNYMHLPVQSIDHVIEIKKNDNGRAVGLGLGILTDMAILIYLTSKYGNFDGMRGWN